MPAEGDFEAEPQWLEGLQELNAVIAATGQPLVGNLFYDHLQDPFLGSAPNPVLRRKRDRFREALAGRARLLEIGVNGGHSAYLALTANEAIEVHGVDVCEHAYVEPAVRWLQSRFPGRVHLHAGDSRRVLPRVRKSGRRFDAFHLDGAKEAYLEDLLNCQRLVLGPRAVVIVDDTQQAHVAQVWRTCLRQGRVRPLAAFPPMSERERYRNEIGTLEPERGLRVPLSRAFLALSGPSGRGLRAVRRVRRAAGRRLRRR